MDHNYRNLLTQLQRSTNNPPPSVFPALSHYLSTVPLPLPTTLTASVIASPAWKGEHFPSVLHACRRATHLKARALLDDLNTGFSLSPGPSWKFRSWIKAICSGARIGGYRVRIAVLGGFLIGLEDMKEQLDAGGARFKVEDEVVIAVAEYFDDMNTLGSWPSETPTKHNSSSSMLYLISDILLLVSEKKMRILDLLSLSRACLKEIDSAFENGNFILSTDSTVSVKGVANTETTNGLPRIVRLASRCIDILSDNPGRRSADLWLLINEALAGFEHIVSNLEQDWIRSELAAYNDENSIPSEAAARGTEIWTRLKSLLFTTVMILQSVVDALLYNESPAPLSNASLASNVIKIFSRVAFISSKFGGLSAQGENAFREYKRAYFTTLDIVLASQSHIEGLVRELAEHRVQLKNAGANSQHPTLLAFTVYYFTTVEQSIDQLSAQCLLEDILPVCREYLGSPEYREAFEASHSVVLALFASVSRLKERDDRSRLSAIRLMVPFYTSSLITCSEEGKLNTEQLRLAFSSLVLGASTIDDNGTLAWFCIESLWQEIKKLDIHDLKQHAQYKRLVLTAVSLIPSLSFSPALLPRFLHELESLVVLELGVERNVLLEAIYEEILRRVGDDQRGLVLKWWYDAFQSDNISETPQIPRSEL